jgi:hypothetical protein
LAISSTPPPASRAKKMATAPLELSQEDCRHLSVGRRDVRLCRATLDLWSPSRATAQHRV